MSACRTAGAWRSAPARTSHRTRARFVACTRAHRFARRACFPVNSDRTCCSTWAERVREYEMSKPERDHRPAFSSAHRRNGCHRKAPAALTRRSAALFGARPRPSLQRTRRRSWCARAAAAQTMRRCAHAVAGRGWCWRTAAACRPFLYRLPFLTKLTIEILYACLPPFA